MSNFPSTNCQWHLADRALTPILSTAQIPSPSDPRPSRQSQAHLQSLTSLTTTAIAAFESASRLGLGIPQRIIVETRSSGPVILHSYLNPPSQRPRSQPKSDSTNERGIIEQARDDLRPLSASTEGGSDFAITENADILVNGVLNGASGVEGIKEEEDESTLQRSPLLVASVIAPTLGEARKAAGGLEKTGREIQKELALEQEEGSQEVVSGGEGG